MARVHGTRSLHRLRQAGHSLPWPPRWHLLLNADECAPGQTHGYGPTWACCHLRPTPGVLWSQVAPGAPPMAKYVCYQVSCSPRSTPPPKWDISQAGMAARPPHTKGHKLRQRQTPLQPPEPAPTPTPPGLSGWGQTSLRCRPCDIHRGSPGQQCSHSCAASSGLLPRVTESKASV